MTKQKPASAHPTTSSACQSKNTEQNALPHYNTDAAGSASLLDAFLDALADKLAARMQAPAKDLWSAADLAERYGVGLTCIRQKMAAGEFGELVQINSRTRMVPLAGVQAYETEHCKQPERSVYAPRTRAKQRPDPGPI